MSVHLLAVVALALYVLGIVAFVSERVAGRVREPVSWRYPSDWIRLAGGLAGLAVVVWAVVA